MQNANEPQKMAGFHFQVDLLNLNLHLAGAETAEDRQMQAHQTAIAQMRAITANS